MNTKAMNTRCQVGRQAASKAEAGAVKAAPAGTEKDETPLQFYTRLAVEQKAHADTLKRMYAARKVKESPIADALWAGYWALNEQANDFAKNAEKDAARVALMKGGKS
jgi:hypothetical protein